MKDSFLKQIKKIKFPKDTKILLAVSGGVDSMVLLHLFDATNLPCAVAHCNFGLRGKESDMDEFFLKSITDVKKISFFSKKFKTEKYAKANKISIQMAARELRYSWFKQLKSKHAFNYIVTAHHRDDSVETLLINLIRGTGFSGLHGIQELVTDIIRPLLPFSKQQIHLYAKKQNITYREDSSNTEDKYMRNKIRNKIIPLMKEINPNVIEAIGKTIHRVQDVEKIYAEFISKKKKKLLLKKNNEYIINIKSLLKENSPEQLLYEIISEFGFYDIVSVFKSFNSASGKEFFNEKFYMIKDRNNLIISQYITSNSIVIDENTNNIKAPFKICFVKAKMSAVDFQNPPNKEMYIDYNKLEFPLLIRSWQAGDSFIPLGMQGFKKISDYFIDQKFSLIEKKKAKLLISNNQIVCIVGERLDERFKLVGNSKKVYIVRL